MIYNELFWYKANFYLKTHYAKGDDVVDITDKDLDISGLGNDNYHKPDFSDGKLDAAISAQNQALQAAEAAQKRAQEAQKAAQKAAVDAVAAQNKAQQTLDEYKNSADRKVNETTTTTRPATIREAAAASTKDILDRVSGFYSGDFSAAVADSKAYNKRDGNGMLVPNNETRGGWDVTITTTNPGAAEANRALEEGRKKNLQEAAKDLQKAIEKLEEAQAQVELANKEAQIAQQKANDATKALEEILAGKAPIDQNKNDEVVEIASGLTKKDAEEQPNFIETGSNYKEWVYRENGDGKKIYNEEHVENYYYPNDGTTFNIYIDISKVTATVVKL